MDQHGGSGFNNNNAVLNNENFNEFNQLMQPGQNGQPPHGQPQHMDHPDQSWRNRATDIRQSLLNKLKEALTSQNYPNAGSMAETYENEAFISANNLKEYQIKLVNWLASIYDSSSNSTNMSLGDLKSPMLPGGINMGGMMNPAGGMMPAAGDNTNSPPDSSTNGLTDVSSTSPKVHDQNSCNNDLVESSGNGTSGGGSATSVSTNPTNAGGKPVTADDLMLATPKSERSLSPTSLSPCTSAVNSPMATTVSTAASSVGSASTTLTSKASSPATSTSSSTTFQCPPPAMPPIESIGILETKTASTQQRTPNSISQQSVQPPPTNGTQRDPQRRISGSGNLAVAANTMPVNGGNPVMSNSIGNNPQSVDSGIGLGSPRSITSASSTTLYSPKIQGTSPSLLPGSDNSPEKATSS